MLFGAAAPLEIVGEATLFAPGIASTDYSEVRLTISPDGRTALWFSRNRPGGAGGYDIWMSRRTETGWGAAEPVPFNSPGRDFDPAFSADGRFVYFCSDRPGGMGGDDLYRVAVSAGGFGAVDSLGVVNSAGNEFAPMLSPDGSTLLFSSDRPGGAGRHDLYVAARKDTGFAPAVPVAGGINTSGDEFDATFLSDGTTIVFARAGDFRTDRVDLFHASVRNGQYDAGALLPRSINSGADGQGDSYGPMLDWSRPGSLTFSAQRPGAKGMDLYTVGYRLE
jgi:Tol biopolymer transport system component